MDRKAGYGSSKLNGVYNCPKCCLRPYSPLPGTGTDKVGDKGGLTGLYSAGANVAPLGAVG